MGKRRLKVHLAVVAGYLAWALTAVLGIGVALVLREGLVKLYVLLLPNPWTIDAMDKVVVIGLILCWIVLAILCEQYYLDGARQGRLWRRVALVMLPCLAVLGGGLAGGVFR
jgi:hypothetical protein